jgi:hypothetical protein
VLILFLSLLRSPFPLPCFPDLMGPNMPWDSVLNYFFTFEMLIPTWCWGFILTEKLEPAFMFDCTYPFSAELCGLFEDKVFLAIDIRVEILLLYKYGCSFMKYKGFCYDSFWLNCVWCFFDVSKLGNTSGCCYSDDIVLAAPNIDAFSLWWLMDFA